MQTFCSTPDFLRNFVAKDTVRQKRPHASGGALQAAREGPRMAVQKKATKVKAKPAAKKAAPRAKKVKPIPDGYPPLCASQVVERCGEAIEFYKKVFGGKERTRYPMPDGKIAHVELGFGSAVL